MMPPAGTSIGVSSDTNTPEANSWTTDYQPLFSSTTIDHSQAEVAKTFHWREFGNGSANGNASYADASTVPAVADQTIAYVMDDGLTSLSSDDCEKSGSYEGLYPSGDNHYWLVTFIGSGINYTTVQTNPGPNQIAQNLPYGTHILKVARSSTNAVITLDGVSIGTLAVGIYGNVSEITINQPKMPPIPEDAVVLADYMLMADYVKSTSTSPDTHISKGLRLISATRDCFHDTSDSFSTYPTIQISQPGYFGWGGLSTSTSTIAAGETKSKLPAFGTSMEASHYDNRGQLFVDNVEVADTGVGSAHGSNVTQDTASVLGTHVFETRNKLNTNHNFKSFGIATPIHTSSHYQTFETPFLHELVGGDRNMEQTNLVVTPDGKTWDEVTRDVSYIGNLVLVTTGAAKNTTFASALIFDEWRGDYTAGTRLGETMRNKDFAIAYDRFICLKEGDYEIQAYTNNAGIATGSNATIFKNSVATNYVTENNPGSSTDEGRFMRSIADLHLVKGDYVSVRGRWGSSAFSNVTIKRIG